MPPIEDGGYRRAYGSPRPRPSKTARSSAGAARPFYPTLHTKVLPSGLLVALEQDMYAQGVGVVSVVRSGFSADPEGAEGLAHLVEHLTFRAIDNGPEPPLPLTAAAGKRNPRATRRERLIYYAAANINCQTSPDAIVCHEFGQPSRLSWLIRTEAARLADPLAGVDQAAFALERLIIGSENGYRDDPRAGMWAGRQLFPLLFPASHPYARMLQSTAARIESLTLADARAFASKHFRPERMTLLVTAPSGMTNLATIISHLPKSLVDERPATRPADDERPPPLDKPAGPVVRRSSPLPVPQLWLGYTLPNGWGPQGPAEHLLARWIQEDMDLEQLRQEDPHIRHVRVALAPALEASALLVRVLLDEGADAERVARVVAGRLASVWTREPAQRELLALLKKTMETGLILNEPPQVERAVEQALLLAFVRKPVIHGDHMLSVHDLPTSDLAKLAHDYLSQARRHAVLFTPAEVGEGPRASRSRAVAARPEQLFADAATWESMELPGAVAPASRVTVKKLPTGLTVVVARRKAAATVAWLGFRGGFSDANPPLVVELARRIRPDAYDAPKNHALCDRGATRDGSIETLEFMTSDLRPALGLLFEKATLPVRSWPARDTLDRMLAQLNPDVDAITERAAVAFARALFGEHPLARMLRRSDLEKVTRSDVDSWVGRVHNLRDAVLIVVGDVDAAEVQRYAGELSGRMVAPAWVEALPAPSPPVLRRGSGERLASVVSPRAGPLVDVRLGCLLPRARVEDRPGLELLRLAVQERLASALRFERGAGYAVNVGTESVRGGAAFMQIITFVAANDLADTLATLRTHWQRWSTSGFDDGELNVARWLLTGQLSVAFGSSDAIAFRLFTDWVAAPDSVGPNSLRVDPFAADTARLNELFATCKSNAVLGLTGNEAVIRRALRQSWPQAR